MSIQSLNPTTGEVEKTFTALGGTQAAGVLDNMALAWESWRESSMDKRAGILRLVADRLRENASEYAALMAREMGKPVAQGRAEIEKSAGVCEFYAKSAASMLAPQPIESVGRSAKVRFEPLGTVLTVMPWNFPFWQVFRIAAPTLMAGNCVVLKHAPNVPQCALAIEEIFKSAGLPENVFRTLLVEERDVEHILAHSAIVGVSLTGGTEAGRSVASVAGRHLRKSVMELGGSDPFIVLADADIEEAVIRAANSRCRNAGQACIAAKRLIVHEDVYDRFVQGLVDHMSVFEYGDPLDESTQFGPMASMELRERLHDQVTRAVQAGGRVLTGGEIPQGAGAYYPPTVIADVPSDAEVVREEFFGPVALVFKISDADEAVRLANDTPYGLSASVWTADETLGLALCRRIESGSVYLNAIPSSDFRMPFGGIKGSGYGRELAASGLREFVNMKSVVIG